MSERDVFSNAQREAIDAILRSRETALRLTLDRHDRDLMRIEHVLFGDPQRGVLGFAARLERIEAAINTLQNQYAAFQTQYDALINHVRNVEKSINALQEQYAALQSRYDALQNRYDALVNQARGIEAAINALQDQYTAIQNRYDALVNQARGVKHALVVVAALLTLFNAPQALTYALRLLGGMP